MISLNHNDADIARYASEVVQDHYLDDRSDFIPEDFESAKKLGRIRQGLLVTGAEQTEDEAAALLKEVILAELDHWVPDASQRLINRASKILADGPILDPILSPDHGLNPGDHALCQEWLSGIFVLRCVTCAHLYKV